MEPEREVGGRPQTPFADLTLGREHHDQISILESSFWPQLRRSFCYEHLVTGSEAASV